MRLNPFDAEAKDTIQSLIALLLIVVMFWFAPDAYRWFSTNVIGREVVIDPRRYEFILLVACTLGGVGTLAALGNLFLLWRRKRGR